jgi:hypothetical protein
MQCTCVVHAVMHVHFRPGNNSWLDALRFVPICTVVGMEAVLRFPSYGELSDMGGPGPSLGRLYEEGNAYIRRHAEWRGMARTTHVRLC